VGVRKPEGSIAFFLNTFNSIETLFDHVEMIWCLLNLTIKVTATQILVGLFKLLKAPRQRSVHINVWIYTEDKNKSTIMAVEMWFVFNWEKITCIIMRFFSLMAICISYKRKGTYLVNSILSNHGHKASHLQHVFLASWAMCLNIFPPDLVWWTPSWAPRELAPASLL
jgi:hypothetical protein